MVEVPSVVGELYEDLAAKYPDVRFVIDHKEYSEEEPVGTVLEQDPAEGTQVLQGSEVAVVISDGPPPAQIPLLNLQNYKEQAALDYLNALGLDLDITIERQEHENVEEGCVIRTFPVEGTILEKNSKITLVISVGPEIKTASMPDLINATRENAEKTLDNQKLDLKIKVEEIYDSTVEKGKVIRTEPDVGGKIKTGDQVTLYVSKGPEMKLMPNLLNMDISSACNVLATAGFEKTPVIEYDYSDTVEKDRIMLQSEEPNTELDVNTVITLTVSQGPKPPVATTQTVTFTLPEGRTADVQVEIRCYGEVAYSTTATVDDTTVSATVSGIGKQTYELWIDGVMVSSQEVDFTAGT